MDNLSLPLISTKNTITTRLICCFFLSRLRNNRYLSRLICFSFSTLRSTTRFVSSSYSAGICCCCNLQHTGMMSHNRNYRNWTSNEDAKLVEALVNMVNSGGYKADNGFKSGYLQHLEQALKVSTPESCILGKPHIESRIKTMKKDWQVVYDMVNGTNTSGFGYDSLKQCVVAEPAVWEAYLKVHKEATKWQNKTFPHFEDLCIVFGKDRAQGNRARDIDQMVEEANMEDQEQQSDDGFGDQEQQSNLRSDECSSQRNKRKSRGDPFLDGLNSAAIFLGEKLEKASDNLAKAELDLQNKTSMLTSELAKMQSLSSLERYKAFRKIARDSELVLNFWALEGEERLDLVRLILDN